MGKSALHEPLESMTEAIGFDEQVRSLYSLEAFADREIGTALARLYTYWEALPRTLHGLPLAGDCQPKFALPADVAEQVCCLETTEDNPLNYIVREHAANPIPGFGSELVGKPLCDRPELDMDTTACAIEFLYCKRERVAMYHEIEQILSGLKRHYTRIMLPVANDAGDVSHIYFAMREVVPVKRVTFHLVDNF